MDLAALIHADDLEARRREDRGPPAVGLRSTEPPGTSTRIGRFREAPTPAVNTTSATNARAPNNVSLAARLLRSALASSGSAGPPAGARGALRSYRPAR